MLLAANWAGAASTPSRGSAATGLTPFVVAAGRRILKGLALQQIGKSLSRQHGCICSCLRNKLFRLETFFVLYNA